MTPCTLCGRPTAFQGADMCNSCWEVDQRIDQFVRSKAGARRVRRALLESGPTDRKATALHAALTVLAESDAMILEGRRTDG